MRLVLIVPYASFECCGEYVIPLECDSKEELYCSIKDQTKDMYDAHEQWYKDFDNARLKLKDQKDKSAHTVMVNLRPRPNLELDMSQWGWHHKLDLDLFWNKVMEGKKTQAVFSEPTIYTVDEWFEVSQAGQL